MRCLHCSLSIGHIDTWLSVCIAQNIKLESENKVATEISNNKVKQQQRSNGTPYTKEKMMKRERWGGQGDENNCGRFKTTTEALK